MFKLYFLATVLIGFHTSDKRTSLTYTESCFAVDFNSNVLAVILVLKVIKTVNRSRSGSCKHRFNYTKQMN